MTEREQRVATALRATYDRWLSNEDPERLAFLRAVLAADWIYTDTTGQRRSRSRYLDDVRRHAAADYRGEVEALEVRLLDRVAVVHGRYRATGTFAGERIDGATTFTSVWLEEEGGGWRCVTHHSTDVLEPRW